MKPAVYILANKYNGTIYIGVTRNLPNRITQHKQGQVPGFTRKYQIHSLVWYCYYDLLTDAIISEKKIKNRGRAYKISLIEKRNPFWKDLSEEILD